MCYVLGSVAERLIELVCWTMEMSIRLFSTWTDLSFIYQGGRGVFCKDSC